MEYVCVKFHRNHLKAVVRAREQDDRPTRSLLRRERYIYVRVCVFVFVRVFVCVHLSVRVFMCVYECNNIYKLYVYMHMIVFITRILSIGIIVEPLSSLGTSEIIVVKAVMKILLVNRFMNDGFQ